MALDGPYTLDDLLSMTRHKSRARAVQPPVLPRRGKGVLRLLGIDPGTLRVGWGVVEHDAARGTLRLHDCGCIAPSPRLELKLRLKHIFAELEDVIRATRPDAAALEETFAGVNMKSAIAMGEGRGIALLSLARAGLRVLELSPRSIKQSVTGSGAAGKTQVAAMVAATLKLKKAPEPQDVTDALAAAIALSQRLPA